MTEEDAKTKWCPFVRFHVEGKAPTFTATPNRDQRGTRCIGSACMAWRWEYDDGQDSGQGYCGLAGAPQ